MATTDSTLRYGVTSGTPLSAQNGLLTGHPKRLVQLCMVHQEHSALPAPTVKYYHVAVSCFLFFGAGSCKNCTRSSAMLPGFARSKSCWDSAAPCKMVGKWPRSVGSSYSCQIRLSPRFELSKLEWGCVGEVFARTLPQLLLIFFAP